MKAFVYLFKLNLRIVYFFMKLLPTQNKVVFISRQSNRISLDFQILSEKIGENHKVILLCKKLEKGLSNYIKYYFHIYRQMYNLATAKVCVLDSYSIPACILKHKKDLEIIQIWHALGAIKKFGYQSLGKPSGRNEKIAKLMCMHNNYDHICIATKEWAPYFSEAFNVSKEKFIFNGLPKMDYLYLNELEIKNKILNKYPKLKKKKNILYVPTFRKNEEVDVDSLINDFDFKNNNLIIKLHPKSNLKLEDKRIFVCKEFTATELITIADYVISDYSAISLEAMSIDKNVLFYLYDYEKYSVENGLNIDLFKEFKPYAFKDIKSILEIINKDKYDKKTIKKLKDKYINKNIGQYTDFLVNFIEKRIK